MKEKIEKKLEVVEKIKENVVELSAIDKLEQLIFEGKHEKEIKSIKGHVIKMKVLSDEERSKAYKLANFNEELFAEETDNMSDEEKEAFADKIIDEFAKTKWALLSYAIIEIDGTSMIDIDKKVYMERIKKFNPDVVDLLYLEYRKMTDEHFERVADLSSFKKKQKTQ